MSSRIACCDYSKLASNSKNALIIEDVRRVLYRLPEVIAAQTVCLAEGEKDADNLGSLGFTATCNPMGAGKWRDEYSEVLRGKDVVIFGDNDDAGRKHVEQVIALLSGKAWNYCDRSARWIFRNGHRRSAR